MKKLEIAIKNCSLCPHNIDTTIRKGNGGLELMGECGLLSRLIQRPDEEYGPFPEWCPLEDFNE